MTRLVWRWGASDHRFSPGGPTKVRESEAEPSRSQCLTPTTGPGSLREFASFTVKARNETHLRADADARTAWAVERPHRLEEQEGSNIEACDT